MTPLSDAQLFYGAPVEPDVTSDDDMLPRLEDDADLADEPAEEQEDAATVMYSDPKAIASSYSGWLRDSVNSLGDATGMDTAAREAHIQSSALVYHDARIPAEQAVTIHNLIAHHAVMPPAPEVVNDWERESLSAVRAKYGDEAPRRLEAARAFVAARPELLELLTRTGMGSHPRVVTALAENAGRFRRPRKS